MHTESKADEYSAASVADSPAPKSPWRVASVEALPGLRLRVAFIDGLSGTVDISGLVQSPRAGVFAALADTSLFSQVRVEYGAVAWPGELDLAPDAMYAAIKEQGVWRP